MHSHECVFLKDAVNQALNYERTPVMTENEDIVFSFFSGLIMLAGVYRQDRKRISTRGNFSAYEVRFYGGVRGA